MRGKIKALVIAGATLGVMATAGLPAASAAVVPGTATLGAGSLTFVPPDSVGFAATLDGTDQIAAANQSIDVLDTTGSGAGWNITLTSTTFTSGGNVLSNSATSDVSASGACDIGSTCTKANNLLSYPIAIPAGNTAPTAVKIMTAGAGFGLGNQTWTHGMRLAIPGNTHAGVYSSTWTYSLVTGP